MRRIYESGAIRRDDDEPFAPREREQSVTPQAARSINSTAWSRRLVPNSVRYRAISIEVSTPRSTYPTDTAVPFQVTMKNAMPFPITIATESPILWTWAVDGHTDASRVPLHDPPDERRGFRFDRGERKRFRKRWEQRFRIDDDEWEAVDPGTYTISAAINVDEPAAKGLYDETTVTIESGAE